MSAFSTATATDILNTYLRGAATPHVQLHSGDPGEDCTANVTMQTDGTTPVVRKPSVHAVPSTRAAGGMEALTSAAVAWSGTEVPTGRAIAWVSIWSALTAGTPRMRLALTQAKTTGSDGISFLTGDIKPGAD